MMSYSAYVHIPFCVRKCSYCAFYSATATYEKIFRFVSALENQIKNTDCPEKKLRSVYFGGGTPSMLSPALYLRVTDAIMAVFDIAGAEITTELNPESVQNIVESDLIKRFTRFSLGVQSFDDEELNILGRVHDADSAVSAYNKLRDSGAKNINIDIMIGLPGKDHYRKLEKTLDIAISLCPEHISAYILTPERNTRLFSEYGFFNEGIAPDVYRYTCDRLENAGYDHYEISNFSKKGYRCEHNMCYWTQQRYCAFGPSACGFDGKTRYRIDCSTEDYIDKCGVVPVRIEETLDYDALESERIMLSLRLSDGTDKSLLDKLMLNVRKSALIERLISSSLARINERGGLSLTDDGFLVSNEIIRNLIS